jgi:hypothetical protein
MDLGVENGFYMNSIVTIGDTNYFPSIALSALQAKKLYPDITFVIYDWGFNEPQRYFLTNHAGAKIIDWTSKFVDRPIPPAFAQLHSVLKSTATNQIKYRLCKSILKDVLQRDSQGKEWLLAQKPYCLLDWSKKYGDGTMLFLDGDAFMVSRIDEIFDGESQISVTIRRPHELDFAYGHCQVINTGVIAFTGTNVIRNQIIEAWIEKMQENFEYLVEQSAMTRLIFPRGNLSEPLDETSLTVGERQVSVKLLTCEMYNYNWIEEGVDAKVNKIVHFKGGRHSGARFRDLASGLGFQKELDIIYQVGASEAGILQS